MGLTIGIVQAVAAHEYIGRVDRGSWREENGGSLVWPDHRRLHAAIGSGLLALLDVEMFDKTGGPDQTGFPS